MSDAARPVRITATDRHFAGRNSITLRIQGGAGPSRSFTQDHPTADADLTDEQIASVRAAGYEVEEVEKAKSKPVTITKEDKGKSASASASKSEPESTPSTSSKSSSSSTSSTASGKE